MALYQINKRRGHFFFFSALLFAFSMSRVLTCSLRIAWAAKPSNVQIAIAASILVNAGILILYIVNLLFAQRLLRARQPELGWHRTLHYLFLTMYALIIVAIILVISLIVLSFYTLDQNLLQKIRDVELAALTYITIFAATPVLIVIASHVLPKSESHQRFGSGSMRHKAIILLITTSLSFIIAGFRAGATWQHPRPRTDPAWYDSKACFYCLGFMIEVIVLSIYLGTRIDQRFHVRDGSSKRRKFESAELDESERDKQSEEPERSGSGPSTEIMLQEFEKGYD